ncbi:hypothetical protein BUALT_Bualt16G0076700 [Buddleja alternifolia]|uniref:Uncharacterized protein n=1 Tax=Buddleja alternifolia TaxID=168488 RepID=A0AAV6W9V8_9LAMI|nr:hypothetical protein BUALT_Bualt16G0076700 [Buddleja alternifolia]
MAYDNPWADSEPKRLGGPPPKLSTRVNEKLARTKEMASEGMEITKEKTKVAAKKVKEGCSSGIHWMKLR